MFGPGAGRTVALWRALLLISVVLPDGPVGFGRAAFARDVVSPQIDFAIPAQPLASALEAFGAASGVDVFYNAALAEQRRSHAVMGSYTSEQAIEILLAGSGHIARATGPGALVIVSKTVDQPANTEAGAGGRYEAYFASLQERLEAVLCGLPRAPGDSRDVMLRIWLRPSGDVARADILGTADRSDAPLANAVGRARFVAPPAGMPQPVTLVVFHGASAPDTPCTMSLGGAVQQ